MANADVILLAAMPAELAGVARRFDEIVPYGERRDAWRTYRVSVPGGEEVRLLTALCGVGAPEAADRIAGLKRLTSPRHLILVGCCGALRSGLGVGRPIVADGFVPETGGDVLHPDELVTRSIRAACPGADSGRFATAAAVLDTKEKKDACRRVSGADVVEMEGVWVARHAASAGIPFASLRFVLDGDCEDLELIGRKPMGGGRIPVAVLRDRLERIAEAIADWVERFAAQAGDPDGPALGNRP